MRSLLACLLLVGCQEYAIYNNAPPVGKGDAPDLATPSKTDTVVQRISPKVDILWVIDNSGSMIEEQEAIARNMDQFLQYFIGSGLDWHIGVITTDTEDPDENGKLREVLGYRYVEPANKLSDRILPYMVQVGVSGSGDERGLLAAWRFFTSSDAGIRAANDGFYREEAGLHVIVISDENDQSSPDVTSGEFINYLRTLKANAEIPVTFSSIVGPNPAGCDSANGNAGAGSTYIDVTRGVGGIVQGICVADWAPVLDELGLLAAGLRSEYFLTQLPVEDTIEVVVRTRGKRRHGIARKQVEDDTTLEEACEARGKDACFFFDYRRDRNSIVTVNFIAPAEAKVDITYDLFSELQPDLGADTGDGATP